MNHVPDVGQPIAENDQQALHEEQRAMAVAKVSDSLAHTSISERNYESTILADEFKLVMTDAYSYAPAANVCSADDAPAPHRNMLKARRKHHTRSDIYAYARALPVLIVGKTGSRFLEAVSLNNSEKVKEMIQNGASPNTTENFRSALHIACSRGYLDTIKVLLENGANPNIRDKNLNTPLHLATCTENIAIVQTLLDYGTNVLLKDCKGHLALEIAISKLRLSERTRSMMRRETRAQIVTVCERIFAAFRKQCCDPELQDELSGHDLQTMFQIFSTQLEQIRRRQLEISTVDSIDSIVSSMTNLQLKKEIDNGVDSLLSTLHQLSFKS